MIKKIAIINDISGYGRCSTSVILPIVSYLGIQGCPLPTAIFSNHTGFPSFFCKDFTAYMPAYIEEWKKLDLHFDGIMTGFLGSARQIAIVEDFILHFRRELTTVIVDPVMGDNGRIYPTYTDELCQKMRRLVAYADITTPNLTEACSLTNTPYHDGPWRRSELDTLARHILDMGARQLVITGVPMGTGYIGNVIAGRTIPTTFQRQTIVKETRSGTGDVFAGVIAADALNGIDFTASVKKASRFVRQCLTDTLRTETGTTSLASGCKTSSNSENTTIPASEANAPRNTGIEFESTLYKLKRT